jgi:hypothetical protein
MMTQMAKLVICMSAIDVTMATLPALRRPPGKLAAAFKFAAALFTSSMGCFYPQQRGLSTDPRELDTFITFFIRAGCPWRAKEWKSFNGNDISLGCGLKSARRVLFRT